MRIEKRILTRSDCYRSGKTIEPNSAELHTIGTAQPSADALANYWDNPNVPACVHYCVDAKDLGKVLQLLPENRRSWADAGFGNNSSITVELMETDGILYTGNGAKYLTVSINDAMRHIQTAYTTAVELFADICTRHGWSPSDRLPNGLHRVYSHQEAAQLGLASDHVDPTHIWPLIGKTMDDFRREVMLKMNRTAHCHEQASDITGSEEDRAEKLLEIVRPIAEAYELLPSVATAQCILESGYCSTDLALNANNICGMKTILSGNTWPGSTWDGKSVYTKQTAEQDKDGNVYYVTADFRSYPCIADSIADRCAYLVGAMNGKTKRYNGITDCVNYWDQIERIKSGGYATDVGYVSKITRIITRFNLDRYDKPTNQEPQVYRVRLVPPDGTMETQIGAFTDLTKAKACADTAFRGYKVYDSDGSCVYSAGDPTAADRIAIACDWAMRTAEDDTHGYDNGNRGGTPDYACSSFVNQAWREAGLTNLTESKNTYTADMLETYAINGFVDVTDQVNVHSGEGIKPGDVLLVPGEHVEMCVGLNHDLVGARGNAYTGKPENGAPGDQTGGEIAVSGYWDDGWKYVLRYQPTAEKYIVQLGVFDRKENAKMLFDTVKATGIPCFLRKIDGSWHVRSGAFAKKEKAEKRSERLKKVEIDNIIKVVTD